MLFVQYGLGLTLGNGFSPHGDGCEKLEDYLPRTKPEEEYFKMKRPSRFLFGPLTFLLKE